MAWLQADGVILPATVTLSSTGKESATHDHDNDDDDDDGHGQGAWRSGEDNVGGGEQQVRRSQFFDLLGGGLMDACVRGRSLTRSCAKSHQPAYLAFIPTPTHPPTHPPHHTRHDIYISSLY